MKNYIVSREQIDIMKHCIGFSGERVVGRKNRKYDAWRNYFTTGEPQKDWDNLVEQGLATKRNFPNGGGTNPQIYHVSQEGFDFLGEMLSVKITETD